MLSVAYSFEYDELAIRGRPETELVLSDVEREELTALTLRRTTAQALALRASIVLGCADGLENKAVAVRQRVTPQTASKWPALFVEHRLDGLLDAPQPRVPCSTDDAHTCASQRPWTRRECAQAMTLLYPIVHDQPETVLAKRLVMGLSAGC